MSARSVSCGYEAYRQRVGMSLSRVGVSSRRFKIALISSLRLSNQRRNIPGPDAIKIGIAITSPPRISCELKSMCDSPVPQTHVKAKTIITDVRTFTRATPSIVRDFEFKRDPELAEYPAYLRRQSKAAHGSGRERHQKARLATLRAEGM